MEASCLSYLVKSLVNVCFFFFFDNCITVSISVILAAVKSSFNRKLGLIHIYMLVMNIFIRACTALALSIFIPPVIRFCDCSTTIICFQLYIVASLAVFQPMIIKGKTKFVNYKTIGITLLISLVNKRMRLLSHSRW